MNPNNQYTKQLSWDDIPQITGFLTPLTDTISQCSVARNGIPAAHLFILQDGLMGILEIDELADPRPADDLALAIGRIAIEARTAAREGRAI